MSSVSKLNYRSSVLVFLLEIRITCSKMQSHPEGAPFVSIFEGIRNDCMAVLEEELGLLQEKADAQALVDAANAGLNRVINRMSRELLTLTGEKPEHALYTHFMKNKSLTEAKKPVLGPKLEHVREWVEKATNSPHATLQALVPAITAAVTAAEQAETAKKNAAKRLKEFRDIGNRRQLVDRLNGMRKETHGTLSRIALEQPGLPSDFADTFFRKAPKRDDDDGEEPGTLEEAQAQVESLREALAEAEQLVAEFEAEAQAEVEAERAREADEAELAAVDEEMARLEAKRASIRARIAR